VRVHEPTVRRDLLFFFAFFSLGLALGLGAPRAVQKAAAAAFLCAFVAFAWWTVRAGGQSLEEAELRPLYLDRTKFDAPATWEIAVQTAGGLALLIGGAELFVEGVLELAEGLDLGPLVITLVLGPLITEIPEKLNSVIWMRESKDTLAVGNITGAMAFQSTVPIGIGLAFSNWELDRFAVTAGMLGLAGGAIAYWALLHRQQLAVPAILGWCAAFGGFVLFAVSGSQP
jgi:cation:H+ antiporter